MISFLSSLHPPSSPLPSIKRCLRTYQKKEETVMFALWVWLKERQMFTKVAILHWFILWWESRSERMAAYSRKRQRPIELNECNQEKAKLLKRVKFSTNSKTYKCNFILRGQVQGYWMSFYERRGFSQRVCWQQHIHSFELSNGSHWVQCTLGEQRWIWKSNNKAFCFIICESSL